MSLASSTGLVSGINYNDIITKLRQADAVPITQLQNQESKINSQSSAMQSIQKLLTDYQSKAQALSASSSFLSMSAVPSDYSVLNVATTGTSSTAGNYSVQVTQLAQASRIASQGVTTSTSTSIATTNGTFKYKAGSGTEVSIAVTTGMTLQDLRDKINNADGAKVRASIVSDGTATNSYRLVLTSSETGQDNAIKITNNDTMLNLSTSAIEDPVASSSNAFNGTVSASGTYTGKTGRNIVMQVTSGGAVGAAKYKVSLDGGVTWTADDAFTTSSSDVDVTGTAAEGVNVKFADNASPVNFAVGDQFTIDTFVPQLQKAQNAVIKVDGIQISRPTNTFSDVIDGATLTARKVSTDPVSVTVQNNASGVTSKIQDFANSYNALVDNIAKATAYDTTNKQAAVLFGDSGLQGILSSLRNGLGKTVPGNSTYTTLSSIGVTMDNKGHLAVDTSKVNTALTKNLADVQNLFIESGKSSTSTIQLVKSSDKTKVGNYAVNITTAAQQAAVSGSRALESSGLAADEMLTIAYNQTAVSVTLAAGLKLDQVVDTLNSQFRDKGMGVQASIDGGKLRIGTTAYGSDQTLNVFSNRDAAAAGQLGIGSTVLNSTGVNVAGTINNIQVTGSGQTLKGLAGTDSEGLELKITALAPTLGTLTLTHGVALDTVQAVNGMTDTTSGIFASRDASYKARIKDYDNQISALNTRLDAEQARLTKQFNELETKLATMQSQGNALLGQLASLVGNGSSA